MAVGLRYLRSDLRLDQVPNSNAQAANTFNVDITGYYQSEEIAYTDFNGRWRGGFALQNLGPDLRGKPDLPKNRAVQIKRGDLRGDLFRHARVRPRKSGRACSCDGKSRSSQTTPRPLTP